MHSSENDIETRSFIGLQFWVFSLVAAAFSTIYITQPVLPILQVEFGVNETRASLTISAVIFGIALSNLPLGSAADRYRIKPIILIGGCVITVCGIVCALTTTMWLLTVVRFIQGLFIPCLTTCVAAYIAPDGYPSDAVLFVHLLFHQLLRMRATPTFATHYAKSCDPELGMFQIFGPP